MYFVITLDEVIEEKHFEENQQEMPRTQFQGWFSSLKKAKEVMKYNTLSIYRDQEGTHNKYVIIEEIQEGNTPLGKVVAWYMFDYNKEEWYEVECPSHACQSIMNHL